MVDVHLEVSQRLKVSYKWPSFANLPGTVYISHNGRFAEHIKQRGQVRFWPNRVTT